MQVNLLLKVIVINFLNQIKIIKNEYLVITISHFMTCRMTHLNQYTKNKSKGTI